MSKNNRTVDRIQAVWNILGGEEGVDALINGELVVSRPAKVWKTWITIKLGTFKNVNEIRKALKAGENNIGNWANDILGKSAFTVSKTEQDVELVNVSVAELGFKNGARYANICKRALELGLDLCPAEIGPQLHLQFKDQPKGTYVLVAMNAITDPGGHLTVFYVEYDDDVKQRLDARDGNADHYWSADRRFVFLRRSNVTSK